MPSISSQPITTPPSIHPRFATISPVPTLSHGCECLPLTVGVSVAHLFQLAWSLTPEQHPAPPTPSYPSYQQFQAIPSPDALDFSFLTTAGNLSLPMVHPSPIYCSSYEDREQTPLISQIRLEYSPSVAQCGINAPNPTSPTSTRLSPTR